MSLAYFCLRGAYLMFFYMHWASYLTRFRFLLYLAYQILTINQFWIYHFQNVCSLYNSLLSVKFLKECLHNSNCHLVIIRQTCFDYTRVLKTLQFICQNKANARRFIGVLITGWLFNKTFQIISTTGNWNSTIICLYIKISHNNEIFIIWWI